MSWVLPAGSRTSSEIFIGGDTSIATCHSTVLMIPIDIETPAITSRS